jgi:hypothetical protein
VLREGQAAFWKEKREKRENVRKSEKFRAIARWILLGGISAADKPAHVEAQSPRERVESKTYAARVSRGQI